MDQREWTAVDDYLRNVIIAPNPVLDAILVNNATAGLPPHDVSPLQGRRLQLVW